MRKLLTALLSLFLVAVAAGLAGCGDGGPDSPAPTPDPVGTGEQETTTQRARAYAISEGLFDEEAVLGEFSAKLTVAQARELLAGDGRPDPFAEITPLLSDDASVWVVTLTEQPSPQSGEGELLESVALVLDGAGKNVLWARKSTPPASPSAS